MPRCVTNWEQRTLARQATAGKAMNIHGDGREEREQPRWHTMGPLCPLEARATSTNRGTLRSHVSSNVNCGHYVYVHTLQICRRSLRGSRWAKLCNFIRRVDVFRH